MDGISVNDLFQVVPFLKANASSKGRCLSYACLHLNRLTIGLLFPAFFNI